MARPEIPTGQPYTIVAKNRAGHEFGRTVVVFPESLRELQRNGYVRDGEQVKVDDATILRRFISGESVAIRADIRPSGDPDKAAARLEKDLETVAAMSPEKLAALMQKLAALQAAAGSEAEA